MNDFEITEPIEVEKVELTKQQQYSRNLRALADWYDGHPNAPLDNPSVSKQNYAFNATPDEIRAIGAGEKVFEGELFHYVVKSEFFKLSWIELRSKICTPRIVGKKTIPSAYYPEREEDIVEWDCPGSLLAEAPAASGEEEVAF